MATRKTTAKTTKKTPKRSQKAQTSRLSNEERQRKVRPGDDLNELVGEVLTAWDRVSKKVRVPDVSPAKLKSLLVKAQRAAAREAQVTARLEERLAPLADARLTANDAVYRAALAVKRIADAVAETHPEVSEAFAVVSERFRRGQKQPEQPA